MDVKPKPEPVPQQGRRGSEFEKSYTKKLLTDSLKDSSLPVTHFDVAEPGEVDDSEQGSSSQSHQEQAKVANTYRMGPVRKFMPHLLQKQIEELLKGTFTGVMYDHSVCKDLADKLADDILKLTEAQGFDRYRYVVTVFVGEEKGQGVNIASRALWDTENDNFVSLSLKNSSIFITAMMYAVYFE
ncbi:TC1D3 protein, partial [Amia calva]|nr:TC1D3 protein [Amia calva]